MTHMMLLWPGLGTIRRIRGEKEDGGTEGGAETDAQDGTKSFTSESCGRAKTGQREEAVGCQEGRAAEDGRPRRGNALDAPQEAGV
jgi:hypothetical protein